MNDKPVDTGESASADGMVSVTSVAYWTGRIMSVPVDAIASIKDIPEARHSTLWILLSPDRQVATLVASDDVELDVACRTDISSWDRLYGITHRDDLLSRVRCRFLADLVARDLRDAGVAVDQSTSVELTESIEADMREFHRIGREALRVAGLPIRPEGAENREMDRW